MNNQNFIEEIKMLKEENKNVIFILYTIINLHTPGIEPGHFDWKSNSLPLTYACFSFIKG